MDRTAPQSQSPQKQSQNLPASSGIPGVAGIGGPGFTGPPSYLPRVQEFNLGGVPLPANPIPNPKSKTGRAATELYDAALSAGTRIQVCREAEADAKSAVREARETLRIEVERGGREGQDQERELELTRELHVRLTLADESVHATRMRGAREAHQNAIAEWRAFVAAHLGELFATEMESDSVAASERLIAARAKLAPFENEYRQQEERCRALAGLAPNPDQWQLATNPEPPLPSRELWSFNAADEEVDQDEEDR